MVKQQKIERLIGFLDGYLNDLSNISKSARSLEDFCANKELKYSAERLLQLITECVIDIGNHIISDDSLGESETSKGIFEILANEANLDKNLSENIKKLIGYRNLIVHSYSKIDDEMTYVIMKKLKSDISKFKKWAINHAK